MSNAPAWLVFVMMLPLAACSKAADKEEAAPSAKEVKPEEVKPETQQPKPTEVVAAKPETEKKLTPSTKEVPVKDYLSKSWAMYMNRVPGGAAEGAGSPAEERAAAKTLRKAAYALYKKKNDTEAVVKYEEALSHWADGDTYYKYGNSLSNIPRLEDSIKAYEIALQLGYEKPEMALYNTACAYSRLETVEPAYEFLAKAIHRGYNAFKFIEKDPDMKFLRGQPDWKKRIEALVPEDVRLGADKLVGTLEVMTPRDPESYILCPGGKLIYDSYIADDGSCCSATHTGTWSVASGDLVVNWTKSCSGVSSGEKVHSAGGCDEFEVCSEKICGPYADVEFAEMILVQREELAAMQTRKTRELFDDGEARVTAFKGAPPFECK